MSKERLERERQETRDAGIDNFVLKGKSDHGGVDNLKKVYEEATDRHVISYAQLCLDFDHLVNTLCEALEVQKSSEILTALEGERVSNLLQNPEFVRSLGSWEGKDFAPGRHQTELKPDTIATLTERYRETLDFYASIDLKKFENFYR
jgi:hypothetical protein